MTYYVLLQNILKIAARCKMNGISKIFVSSVLNTLKVSSDIGAKLSFKILPTRNSHRRCSVKKSVLKNFANLTEKHLCWSLLTCNFIKLQHRCFSVRFAKFLRTPILKNICERLLLSNNCESSRFHHLHINDFFL